MAVPAFQRMIRQFSLTVRQSVRHDPASPERIRLWRNKLNLAIFNKYDEDFSSYSFPSDYCSHSGNRVFDFCI
jgi:hypothetical protein